MPVASSARSGARAPSSAPGSVGSARSLALRGAAVLGLSAAAAVAASSLLFTAPVGSPARAARTFPEVRSVPLAEAASFAILRRPLRATDVFAALHPGSGPLGANPSLARTVNEPVGGLSVGVVSVVPANGGVCLRVPFAQGGAQWWCQTLALARMGKLAMALRPAGPLRAGQQLLIGLVPDGVRTVTVSSAGGARRSVPVHANVYDAQISAPQTISIDLPGYGLRRYAAP